MESPPPTRAESLETLARAWIRLKNTARPSANTAAARSADLVVIAAELGDRLERPEPKWLAGGGGEFERALGRLSPADLTPDALGDAFAGYAEKHAPASIRRVLSTWRGFCKWLAVDRGVLKINPVERLEGPSAGPWRPKPISESDLAKLVAAAASPAPHSRSPWAELERALCALLVTAGLRVSEITVLTVGDVHRSPTEHARLHVTGKGGRVRTVPLPPETLEVIDGYLESRKARIGRFVAADPLLIRASGRPLTRRAIDHLVAGWYMRAGLTPPQGALAHSLRHTFATLLVDHGGSLPEVQRLLGHASLSTTQAYLDVTAHGLESTALANPARALLRGDSR